jgi:hypothetical protein
MKIKILAVLSAIVLIQTSSLASIWLMPGSPVATSKENIDELVQVLLVDGDKQAAMDLMSQGKILESRNARQEIILIGEEAPNRTLEFRLKGKNQKLWTLFDNIEVD